MSVVANFEAKLKAVKGKVEGDMKDLVLYIESVFHHIQASHVEDVVKNAVVSDLHAATVKIDNVANTIRIESDLADKAVDAADAAVTKAVKKK
jgi:hypothetical protein